MTRRRAVKLVGGFLLGSVLGVPFARRIAASEPALAPFQATCLPTTSVDPLIHPVVYARNQRRGDCADTVNYIGNVGVSWPAFSPAMPAGHTPGKGGMTLTDRTVDVTNVAYTIARRGKLFCATPTASFAFREQSQVYALSWMPPASVSSACQAEAEQWDNTVLAHEAHHVAEEKSIADQYQQKFGQITYPQICASSRKEVKREIAARVETDRAAIAQAWAADAAACAASFEQTAHVRHPNCCACSATRLSRAGDQTCPDTNAITSWDLFVSYSGGIGFYQGDGDEHSATIQTTLNINNTQWDNQDADVTGRVTVHSSNVSSGGGCPTGQEVNIDNTTLTAGEDVRMTLTAQNDCTFLLSGDIGAGGSITIYTCHGTFGGGTRSRDSIRLILPIPQNLAMSGETIVPFFFARPEGGGQVLPDMYIVLRDAVAPVGPSPEPSGTITVNWSLVPNGGC